MRVLIVEDEPYLAEAVRDGLRLEAIAADIAGDGNAALELLSINSYDLARSSTASSAPPARSPDESSPPAAASRSSCSPLPTGSTTRLPGSSSAPTTTSPNRSSFESSSCGCGRSTANAHARPPVSEIAGLRLDPFRRRSSATDATSRSPGSSSPCSKSSSPPKAVSSAPKSYWSGPGTRTPTPSPTPSASPSLPCATTRRTMAHRHGARRRLPNRHRHGHHPPWQYS